MQKLTTVLMMLIPLVVGSTLTACGRSSSAAASRRGLVAGSVGLEATPSGPDCLLRVSVQELRGLPTALVRLDVVAVDSQSGGEPEFSYVVDEGALLAVLDNGLLPAFGRVDFDLRVPSWLDTLGKEAWGSLSLVGVTHETPSFFVGDFQCTGANSP